MAQANRYIVTGGAGFVGSNLVAALIRREPSCDVVVVDNFRTGSTLNIVEACERAQVGAFKGDIIAESTAELEWNSVLEGIEPAAIFHLAAITDTTVTDEREMLNENVEGFRPVLLACAEAGTPLMYASSAATYGSPRECFERIPFPEESAGAPNNVYGFSKWMMETLHARADEGAMAEGKRRPHVVGLRYFNVFGPGEARKGKMASMAYQLAGQILAGGRPRLFTPGDQARDQVHVDDVVACSLAAADRSATPGVYNCGSGVATSFADIADAVRTGLEREDAETEFFEMPASVREFYQDFTCADLNRTKAALTWEP